MVAVSITQIMMIFLCWLTARTVFRRCSRKLVGQYRIVYGTVGTYSIGATLLIFHLRLLLACFALVCFVVAIAILTGTFLAIRLPSIYSGSMFMKARQRRNVFAFGASFRYDCFRHNQFLCNWLLSGPVASTNLLSARSL